MENLEEVSSDLSKGTKVFINGVWQGIHREPAQLVHTIKRLRRCGDISHEVSVVRDVRERELRIFTDAGRVCRPLYIIDEKKQELLLTKSDVRKLAGEEPDYDEEGNLVETSWSSLVSRGVVEYLDADEEETVMICMAPGDLDASRDLQAGRAAMETDMGAGGARVKNVFSSHTWTHCEIHPAMILGICASIIPFPDHNQVRAASSSRCLTY